VVEIQTISILFASAGVLVAAVYYLMQIRHQTKMRQTDLLVRLAPWLSMSSGEFLRAYVKVLNLEFKDYDDFIRKYGPPLAEKPEQMALMTVGNYFEAVGTLLRRKLLDVDLVWDYWGETYIAYWQKTRCYIEGIRREVNQPEFGDASEYLFNEMHKREQQQEASKTV